MVAFNQQEYILQIEKRLLSLSKFFSLKHNKDNIMNLVAKGRLREEIAKFVLRAMEIVEQVYPGKWDIQFDLKAVYKTFKNTYGSNHVNIFQLFDKIIIDKIYVVIKFDALTVINSRKQSLDIKDLFVRIPIELTDDTNIIFFNTIQGIRTTISMAEYSTGYQHSHLPGGIDDEGHMYKEFCTGTGDINSTTSLLNVGSLDRGFDYSLFELLLHQIDPFVKWESIEGRPHRHLENTIIKNYNYPLISFQTLDNYYNTIVSTVKRRRPGERPKIDWKFEGGRYRIIDNDTFEDFFRSLKQVIEFAEDRSNKPFVHKNEAGEYFVKSELNASDISYVFEQNKWIPFRGEKVLFKLDGDPKIPTNNTVYIHPQIKNYVKSRFEYIANTTKAREVRASNRNTPVHS